MQTNSEPETRDFLIAALQWQIELGAQTCIGETFIDRTVAPPPSEKPPAPASASPRSAATLHSPSDASGLAKGCKSLEALRDALSAWPHPLKEGARNCVFADGNPAARVMIIGEAPGREEDLKGLPFVGRSGQLLDRMLTAIGLDRRSDDPAGAVYITNILPWRPMENRTPSAQESQEFLPFVEQHVALIDPLVIVTMGNAPTKPILETTTGITKLRGNWAEADIGGKTRPLLPMLHPAYLLRQPMDKHKAWHDLLLLEARIKELS